MHFPKCSLVTNPTARLSGSSWPKIENTVPAPNSGRDFTAVLCSAPHGAQRAIPFLFGLDLLCGSRGFSGRPPESITTGLGATTFPWSAKRSISLCQFPVKRKNAKCRCLFGTTSICSGHVPVRRLRQIAAVPAFCRFPELFSKSISTVYPGSH